MAKKKTPQKKTDQSNSTPPFIVGIGASSGGVEALTQFFEQVPSDSGLAYVVILHLSPDYDSQLTKILSDVAQIPVTQVIDRMEVEANQVYVIPPNQHLVMEDGFVIVQPNAQLEDRRAPVDIFFRTLAESHGLRAIAVILSGSGANGSMGLKRVKEQGGAVFVQNPREAAFNEMPRHAIATNLVDDILPVAQIPARLIAYRERLGTVAIPEESPQRPEDLQQALREVFTQLRVRTGHDFSNYKRSTLLRRLERRISIYGLPSLPAYAAFLRDHPEETQALLKDLLISVTNFFRDQPIFTYLEQQLLPLLLEGGKESIRIWVAGCATGEEAYSLAMLCAELTVGIIEAPKIQIFATDIDQDAIAMAREGLYTLNDAADVSAERLGRFFKPEGQQYRISREIREMVLFAHHNVLKDPPFSQLDLVSCRNLLIYLNAVAQERVMETFHFALKPGSYLLLGMSETVDGSSDLYATVNRELHIYQSRQVASRPYPVPEGIPQLPQPNKRSFDATSEPESRPVVRISYGDLHQQLLEQYAPPSIIVNEDYDILHLTERAGRYLQMGGGEPSKNLLRLIRPELRLELRTALYQATQQQINVDIHPITLLVNDQTETLTLHVRPVLRANDPARGFVLILFEPISAESVDIQPVMTSTEPVARQLEEELIRTKSQLRLANEHHELQAEELKASNEELQAMNEELRSAAEELETGKEELQSINEELTTVNQELKIKIEEVSLASNNLQNLINSTNIATLFLDRSFRLKLFTPATRQLFNLIPSDIGRPLSDVTNRLDYPDLQTDAEEVLTTLRPIEREVKTNHDEAFIMRVLPYRTAEDRISGIVLTFVDITARKQAEEALRQSEERQAFLLQLSDALRPLSDPTAIQDMACRLLGDRLAANRVNYAEIDGEEYSVAREYRVGELPSMIGRYPIASFRPAERTAFEAGRTVILADILAEPSLTADEATAYSALAVRAFVSVPLLKAGRLLAVLSVIRSYPGPWTTDEIAIIEGVAERTWASVERSKAEVALRQSEEKYRTLFNAIDEGVGSVELIYDANNKVVDYEYLEQNPAFRQLTGLPNDVVGKRISELIPNLEAFWFETFERVAKTGESQRFEHEVSALNRWFDVYVSRVGGEGSRRIVYIYTNITQRKRHEKNLLFLADISHDLTQLITKEEMMNTISAKVGQYFRASVCALAEVNEEQQRVSVAHDWNRKDVPSWKGVHNIIDYHTEELRRAMRAGETYVVRDTTTDPRVNAEPMVALSIGAFVSVPLLRNGNWQFLLSIADSGPRDWHDDEIDLLNDITARIWTWIERARAEESLRESKAQLVSVRSLTLLGQTEDLAQVGSWEYDRATGAFHWSEGMYKLFSLKPGQPIQPEIYLEKAVDGDQDKAQRLVAYICEGSGSLNTDLRIGISEVVKTLRIKADVVGESDQCRVLGVDLDMTDQLMAQQQIQRTAEDLQAVLNTSPASIGLFRAVHDKQNPEQITDFCLAVGNERLAQFAGQLLTELLDQSVKQLSPLLWGDDTLAILRQAYDSREYRYMELKRPIPNQDDWLAISLMRQDDGVVLTGLDITELKQIQAQQSQWLSELEVSRHSADALVALKTLLNQRTELVRSISHDLRGNFGVINGGLTLLRIADSETERAQVMEMVTRNIQQATGLLTNLLDLARLEMGQQQRAVTSFNASLVLRELSQSLRLMADEQALELRMAGPDTLVVENDQQLVYRIAQNLIINALKYTHQGSITVEWGEAGDRWWFAVVDTGPGLAQELVARLNSNEVPRSEVPRSEVPRSEVLQQRGEGIGLRIVRELAHLLEAHLQVSSEAGEGTRFLVSLPIRYIDA